MIMLHNIPFYSDTFHKTFLVFMVMYIFSYAEKSVINVSHYILINVLITCVSHSL